MTHWPKLDIINFIAQVNTQSKLITYNFLWYSNIILSPILNCIMYYVPTLPTASDLQFIMPPLWMQPPRKYVYRRHPRQYHLRQRALRRPRFKPPPLPSESPDPIRPVLFQVQHSVPTAIISSFCDHVDFIGLHRMSTLFSPQSSTLNFQQIEQEWLRLRPILYHSLDPSPTTRYLSPPCIFLGHAQSTVPVVIDSGASDGLTPFRADFITYTSTTGSLNGIGSQSQICGYGKVRWKVIDQHGQVQIIETTAYHVPSASIRLYSPQKDFIQHQRGSLHITASECTLQLPNSTSNLSFPFHPTNNLPLMVLAPNSENDPQQALVVEEDFSLDPFSGSGNTPALQDTSTSTSSSASLRIPTPALVTPPPMTSVDINNAILDEHNINLSRAQAELLGWHYRFGHVNMHTLQRFMHPLKKLDNQDTEIELGKPCLVTTRNARTHSCTPPQCAACILAKMERCPTSTSRSPGSNDAHSLRANDLNPGDRVSMDQYVVSHKGRTLTNSSRDNEKYNGGTLFVDHASGYLFNHLQISLRSGETLVGKRLLEREATEHGTVIRSFQADNGVFTSAEFKEDLDRKQQPLHLSGVGAHHQNGVAERSIKTVSYLARSMLIHSALRWPRHHSLDLWPFALQHAVYIWNQLPSNDGFSPQEKWCGVKNQNNNHIRRLHPWGCPAYVLDPKLQDGKKLPKWHPRSRQGKFLGYSSQHASNVGLILNPVTKRISPQFHVLFDDFFTTVRSVDDTHDPVLDEVNWDQLIRTLGTDRYFEHEDVDYVPPIADEWLSPEERQARVRRQQPIHQREPPVQREPTFQREPIVPDPPLQREITTLSDRLSSLETPQPKEEIQSAPQSSSSRSTSEIDPSNIVTGRRSRSRTCRYSPEAFNAVMASTPSPPFPLSQQKAVSHPPTSNTKQQSVKVSKPRNPCKKFFNAETYNAIKDHESVDLSAIPQFYNVSQAEGAMKKKHTGFDRLDERLQQLDWDTSMSALAASTSSFESQQLFNLVEQYEDPISDFLDDAHPLMLAAKLNDQDTPRWKEATRGENAEGFWQAMWIEICTLIKMGAWELVDKKPDMHVVPSTWAFKIKRYPTGLVRKLKARFCVRGDLQKDGVDVFETYAPVVSWMTIRLLLILSVVLELETVQVDYTAAFCQAHMTHDVFINLSLGWQRLNKMGLPVSFAEGKVLKLKRSLYGQRDSPRNWFLHLKGKLEEVGMKQSAHDPCLFIGRKTLCLVYVDDCLFFSPDKENIHQLIQDLKKKGLDLNIEDDVAGFLGLQIKKLESGFVSLTQIGLIDRIIKALHLEDANPKFAPAPKEPLGKDPNGTPFSQEFNYASVIGMLLYLLHSQPEISFAVSQCARYTHNPTEKHATYLKHIGKYLKHTRDKGLLLNPKKDAPLDIQCYVDADFAGLWNQEEQADPHCVRSRSGYVILIAGCPVLWKSKLQSLIAQSTMESEYIALSTACKELLPLQRIVKEVAETFELDEGKMSEIRSTIWEDNEACLKLANLELPYMTNRSKHIALKYHWFREHTNKEWVVKPIASICQLADLFTKGLAPDQFEKLRFQIMGW